MDTLLDWLDTPLSETAELQNKVRTQEEIRVWATPDNLGEARRALFILQKGRTQQKLTILSKLEHVITEHLGDTVLQFVLVNAT